MDLIPKIKSPSEDMEQAWLIKWFRRQYPAVRIFAIPNGGHRRLSVAVKLKATGVSPGVPDLQIPAWNLWVEMKRSDGVPSDVRANQREWIEYLIGVGHTVIIGYGWEDAQRKISEFDKKNPAPGRVQG
tara:strand:- start:216 stop:602 length:387 start_codon:yes stop_codon:yes gene_type:complete